MGIWKCENHYKLHSIYSPPRNSPNFDYLNNINKSILIGEFNAHSPTWGYSDINAAEREIEDLLQTKPVELIFKKDDAGTFLHYNGSTTSPDLLIVSSDISHSTERKIIDDPGSGHRPVIANISINSEYNQQKSYCKPSWNFKKANWSVFITCWKKD